MITRGPSIEAKILPLDHYRPTMASSSSKARRGRAEDEDTFSCLSHHLTADLGFSSKREQNERGRRRSAHEGGMEPMPDPMHQLSVDHSERHSALHQILRRFDR